MFKKTTKKSPPKPKPKVVKKSQKRAYTSEVLAIVIVLLVVALAGFFVLLTEYNDAQEKISDYKVLEDQLQKDELSGDLLTQVGKHMRLPNETPQIATVANIDNLVKNQPFFQGSKNGDRVLIYSDKIIIYDEAEDIIVNVGFVVGSPGVTGVADTPQEVTETEEVEEEVVEEELPDPLTIEIRNGSTVKGLAGQTRSKIVDNEDFLVTGVANAARSSYEEGVIVDMTDGTRQDLVFELKDLLGLPVVGELPAGEVGSPAEIVVIVVE